jgi:thiamine-phosphate diphosphorylase
MTTRLPPALIALSPGDLTASGAGSFLRAVEACVSTGLRGLLLREPTLSDRATLELALALRPLLAGAWLGLHDRVHLAEGCDADAVHLGFRSLTPSVAREILPPSIAIGFSAHAHDEPSSLRACDYLFFGPVLDTPSKRGIQEPTGFAGLQRIAAGTSIPVWGIGGIRPQHVAELVGAGASGIAVRGGILGAGDPAAACGQYLDALRAAGDPGALP